MRKPVIVALLLVLVLTLVVLGFSYFIQPILPPQTNNFLFLFFLALVGVIGVLAGFPDIIDRLKGKNRTEIDERQKQLNRQTIGKDNAYGKKVEGNLLQTSDVMNTGNGPVNIAGGNIQTPEQHIFSIENLNPEEQYRIATYWHIYDPKPSLSRFNLKGVDLSGVYLSGANLSKANLENANLKGADLHNTILNAANLIRANLEGANLQNASFRGADLSWADLRNTNLETADTTGVDLYGAVLPNRYKEIQSLRKLARFLWKVIYIILATLLGGLFGVLQVLLGDYGVFEPKTVILLWVFIGGGFGFARVLNTIRW